MEIKIEEVVDCLILRYKLHTWQLKLLIIAEVGTSFKAHVYAHFHNGLLQWLETTKGLALSKFMNVIPNEIRDEIPNSPIQ